MRVPAQKGWLKNCDDSGELQATEGVLDWVPFNMFLSVLSLLGPEPVPERGERRERRERAYGSVGIGWEYTGQDVTSVVIWELDLIISDIIASE